jgi:hypothetical protein
MLIKLANIHGMNRIHRAPKKMKHAPINIIEARIAAMRLGHGSLLKFVVSRGWPKSTAWYAMQGKLNGPLSKRIVTDVKEALGC